MRTPQDSSLRTFRPLRFMRSLILLRKVGWTWHNVKALWIQSAPNWRIPDQELDLTDGEWDRFMEALDV